jgi:hypothetical protein
MTMRTKRWLLVLALAAPLSGCLLAAAGAGAGAAVYLTSRGASSVVQAGIDDVFARAEAVFEEMGVGETGRSTEDSGAERRLLGRQGELEITVEMQRETMSSTKVDVYVRRSAVEWDRDYARSLLDRIIARGR